MSTDSLLDLSDSEYLVDLYVVSVGSLGISIGSLLDLHGISIGSLLDFAWICNVSLLDLQWISIGSLFDLHVISIGLLLLLDLSRDVCWISIVPYIKCVCIFTTFSYALINIANLNKRFLKIPSIMYAFLQHYGPVGAKRVSLPGSR